DVIELKSSLRALKAPQARLGIVVAVRTIQLDGSDGQRFIVGAKDTPTNFSGREGVHVVLEARTIRNAEGRQPSAQRLLREFKPCGEISGVNVFACMDVIESIDAVRAGAGSKAIVFRAQLELY